MIATMDIGKAMDENGNVITPPLEFTTGFVRFVSFSLSLFFCFFLKKDVLFISFSKSHPKPFKCSIRPRSEQAVMLIQQGEYVFSL